MNINSFFTRGSLMADTIDFIRVIVKGLRFLSGVARDNKVVNYQTPEQLKTLVSCPLPNNPSSIRNIFKNINLVGKYSVSQSDLRYLAFPDSANSKAALLGEVYSKFLNQNLISFDRGAPIATFIEMQVIEWLRELIGYDHKPLKEVQSLSEVSGMWTTGGHMSNHMAIMCALNARYPQIKEGGLSSLKIRPKIIVSDKISHYSISSAMHHLGLGRENIIDLPTNDDFTSDYTKLDGLIGENKGGVFMVVGVAGNTRTSSLDNLKGIGQVCQKHNVWFHVDACHGGSLLFSKKLKERDLAGIELADSVSLDPHKGMFVTYPSSYIIFKKRDTLVMFTRYEKDVRSGMVWDIGYITPFFGSRGFESLKLWLLFKHLGIEGLRKVVEIRDDLAKYAADLVENSGQFILLNHIDFYRLTFVYFPKNIFEHFSTLQCSQEILDKVKNCVGRFTHEISESLYHQGDLCVDEFRLHDLANYTKLNTNDKINVLSITIGNPLQTKKSLRKSIGVLIDKSRELEPQFELEVLEILNNNRDKSMSISRGGPAGW